jgi:3-keto-5-aminohexanoate cleavage enzyme
MNKLIITAALTGGFHGKEANPNLPEQPDEIVQAAYECWQSGAAMVHLHARDKQGKPTEDVSIHTEIVSRIKAKCDVVVQVSTGGGPGLTPEQRIKVIDSNPEMASLNMGTMVRTRWGDASLFLNSRSQIEDYAKAMLDKNIKPEMEVCSHSMLVDVENLISKGLIKKPYYVNLVLGMTHQGALPAQPKHLLSLIEYLPPDSIFNVSGVGVGQLPLTTLAMILGGHARVGLEDNVFYKKGVLADSNAQLVERTVRLAQELGREIASPSEVRGILQLG